MGKLPKDENGIKHDRDDNLVNILNQANAVTILLHLLDHKEAVNNTFRRPPFNMTWKVIFRLFDAFYDQGIVQHAGTPSRPLIALTEKGILLAKKVAVAVEKLEPIPVMKKKKKKSTAHKKDKKTRKTSPLVSLFSLSNEQSYINCVSFLYNHPEGLTKKEIKAEFPKAYYILNKLYKLDIIKHTGYPSAPKLTLTEKGIGVALEMKN